MTKRELLKRYIIFFFGVMGVAFGVALVTNANLGNSPISSIPYSLSLVLPELTLGNWTIIFNYLLILGQWLILKKRAKKGELLLQALITLVFGYCIDFAMFCLQWLVPQIYLFRVLLVVFGAVVLAFGVYFQLLGGVVMLPGDAFARALITITHKEFGSMRLACDIAMSLTAAVLCLIFLGNLSGVREGTVICAVLIGNFVKIITRKLKPFAEKILP